MITRAMQVRPQELYPLRDAVAVCRLAAPRPDMNVVLERLGGLRSAVLPLLLDTVLTVALRGLPLRRILLGVIALLRRFAPLPA